MMKKILFFLCVISYILQAQVSHNVNLLYNWQDSTLVGSAAFNNIYNEVWGVVINNREYAIIGSTAGTHIFDVSDPINSYEAAFIAGEVAGAQIIHRDYHDYNGYLYIVADEGQQSKLKIVDLSSLPSSVSVVYNSSEFFNTAHNIFIDTATAKLYACGSDYISTLIFSLADPTNPTLLMDYTDLGYAHDVYVQNDTAYLNAGGAGLYIVDFSDMNSPQIIGSLTQYPYKGYNHSGWLSEDGSSYFFADENHGYLMKSVDVSDFSNITVVDTFNSSANTQSMAHNLIVKDNYLYVSHYHDGLQIFDISNPSNVIQVAYYKTYQPNDYLSYRGAWGVYPLLPSGNILVSDMQYGLFVLQAQSLNVQSQNDNDLYIYPNPFTHHINLNTDKNGVKKVKVYNVSGELVINKVFVDQKIILNTSNLEKGIYFLQLHENSIIKTEKIINF